FKVKTEQPDAEVEAKLRALNAKFKAEALAASQNTSHDLVESEDSGASSSPEDKKAIAPVKSSNEILAELFGVFNAAPPQELLDDRNLLRKRKKVKKEKKSKKRKHNNSDKSDGECKESYWADRKHHRHQRKKHKHKDIKDKGKDRDLLRERDKSAISADASLTTKAKKKDKLEGTKRFDAEAAKSSSDPQPVEKRQKEKDRDHRNNSFYNSYRDAERSRESEADRTKVRTSRDFSDISLSDEESYLQEKISNGRRRTHNPFYDGKQEHKGDSKAGVRQELQHGKRAVRDPDIRRHRRSRSRTRSRSRDLGIDKKRLLEIARKNAIHMFKQGSLPGIVNMSAQVKDKVLVKMRYGGRTVQDLTNFCKKISNGDGLSDLSSDEDSDVDKNGNAKAFHHPFQIKEREPIVMHIRNSKPLVPSTSRREDQTKAITMQFPVSSGQTHRMNEVWVPVALEPLPSLPPAKQSTNMFKDTQKNVFAKSIPLQQKQEPAFKPLEAAAIATAIPPDSAAHEPVPPSLAVAKQSKPEVAAPFVPEVPVPSASPAASAASQSIFQPPPIDVSSIITERLSAIRRLQDNPADSDAQKMMNNAQRNMSSWATSKYLPGQFTGSTGAHVLKAHELNSGPQLWARKDQLTSTKPVTGGMGMALLQKMGWKPGEGLGRAKTGSLQPLLLDVKLDKRGLVSRDDLKASQSRQAAVQRRNKPQATPVGAVPVGTAPGTCPPLITQDKHPVCVLNELTSKNKWTPPQYTLCENFGPPHNRSFLFSVEINGRTYTPDRGCHNKKEAKLNAAKLCLRDLGILPPS
ncbi:hypothetical protein KR018_001866, partial [Drosophila ironensis]